MDRTSAIRQSGWLIMARMKKDYNIDKLQELDTKKCNLCVPKKRNPAHEIGNARVMFSSDSCFASLQNSCPCSYRV